MQKRSLKYLLTFFSIIVFLIFTQHQIAHSQTKCSNPNNFNRNLPPDISRLIETNNLKTFAVKKHYKNTTVLFADIVNFTSITSRLDSSESFDFLKRLYAGAENLAELYPNLWIVKYEGDKIMALIRAPNDADAKTGATEMVRFAIQLLELMQDPKFWLKNEPIQLRIGISSGDLTGGIISEKNLTWDIIGTTVNKASRMESNGKAGKITVSEETKSLIEDSYNCSLPESRDIKGLGQTNIYFINNPNQTKK